MFLLTKKRDPEMLIELSKHGVKVLVFCYQMNCQLSPIAYKEFSLDSFDESDFSISNYFSSVFQLIRDWLDEYVHVKCHRFYLFLRSSWVFYQDNKAHLGFTQKNLLKNIHLIAMKKNFYLKERVFTSLFYPLKLRFFHLHREMRMFLIVDRQSIEIVCSDLGSKIYKIGVVSSIDQWMQEFCLNKGIERSLFLQVFFRHFTEIFNSSSEDQIFYIPSLSQEEVVKVSLSQMRENFLNYVALLSNQVKDSILSSCLSVKNISEIVILGQMDHLPYLDVLQSTLSSTYPSLKVWTDLPVQTHSHSMIDFYFKWIENKSIYVHRKVRFRKQINSFIQKTWSLFWGQSSHR